MAVLPAVLVSDWNVEIQRIKWLLILNGDSGGPAELGNFSDRSVQVVGTFGVGGSLTIQGSNDGAVTWHTLTDPQGVALTFTAGGLRQVLELPFQIRPIVTAGDGTTSLGVHLFMRKDAK